MISVKINSMINDLCEINAVDFASGIKIGDEL
jgi:hypothetical protein